MTTTTAPGSATKFYSSRYRTIPKELADFKQVEVRLGLCRRARPEGSNEAYRISFDRPVPRGAGLLMSTTRMLQFLLLMLPTRNASPGRGTT